MARIPPNISALVAPTTYIMFCLSPHSWDFFSTFSYNFSPSLSKNWKSKAPLLEVKASKITHFPSYCRKGVTESSPIYGATVIASKSSVCKKAFAYIWEVFPMSPRFASAMMKTSGYSDRMYFTVFSKLSHPSTPRLS